MKTFEKVAQFEIPFSELLETNTCNFYIILRNHILVHKKNTDTRIKGQVQLTWYFYGIIEISTKKLGIFLTYFDIYNLYFTSTEKNQVIFNGF